jgi:hypothetical protein
VTITQLPAPRPDDLAAMEPPLLPAPLPGLRRRLKHPRLMHHNRLAAGVLLANLAVLIFSFVDGWWAVDGIAVDALSNAVLANFALAILIRQQYVINALFWLATRAPTSWPLRVRWTLAKVYHFGGIHVGGAVAGTLWFLTLAGAEIYHVARGLPGVTTATMIVSCALVALLIGMTVMARPSYRARSHNTFERMHRFGGWAALGLFWATAVLAAIGQRGSHAAGWALAHAPGVWVLLGLTFSIALPWLRLRRVPITIERPSSHVAVVRFEHGRKPFAGSSTAISRNPLREWHSFANVPSPDQDGFRLTISRAGDWTGKFIDDAPSHVWVKGITTAGVANIETLFTRVVYVATGSGIGPVLPHLLEGKVPSHLVWATRDPRVTYGDGLVDEILLVQPGATIFDTAMHGKPDMVQMAYEAYVAFDAEAVICISNKQLTWRVVQGLEERGIPAYGAIWDS